MRIILPLPAGGGADIFARRVGRPLRASLVQQFVAHNRAGTSGIIGLARRATVARDAHVKAE